jgi:hypothetical protein
MSRHRPRRVSRRSILAIAVVALAAGCQSPSVDPPAGHALALRVDLLPGGPSPAGELSLPRYALYADGTLIAQDGVDGDLPVAKAYHLTHSAFLRMYDRAASAGLAASHDYDVQAPDASTLVITFVTSGGRFQTRIVAPEDQASGAAGAAAQAVAFTPTDLAEPDMTSPPGRYVPARIAVNSAYAKAGTAGAPAWPLPALGDGTAVHSGDCEAYGPPRLDQVSDLGRHGPADRRWASGGATYQVFFRPLLPDESGCASLAAH